MNREIVKPINVLAGICFVLGVLATVDYWRSHVSSHQAQLTSENPRINGAEGNFVLANGTDNREVLSDIRGRLFYTSSFFTSGEPQPTFFLEDHSGFVMRNRNFVVPIESQTLGRIVSDLNESPIQYELALPISPRGTLHDVNQDGIDDLGVMIFAVSYASNIWGDSFIEARDHGRGWSVLYTSVRISEVKDHYYEVAGGKYLVFAPDDAQHFPAGFGADRKLFTEDDPMMPLPAHWSVIDMDHQPFQISTLNNSVIDLYELESGALDDFSRLSYSAAYDRMVEKFRREYAWTELKQIDWDSLKTTFQSRIDTAEEEQDALAYSLAIRDFTRSIPDSHVYAGSDLLESYDTERGNYGIGLAMLEWSDGTFHICHINDEKDGTEPSVPLYAEVLKINDIPISDYVDAIVPTTSPFSNPVYKRLEQTREALRFDQPDVEVKIEYRIGIDEAKSVVLRTIAETASRYPGIFKHQRERFYLPVEYEFSPNGYGLIRINDFFDDYLLTIRLWERALKYFKRVEVPGIIVDVRNNGGGLGWVADQMAGYFFSEEKSLGNGGFYNESIKDFHFHSYDKETMLPAPADLQFHGPVAVLISHESASAAEFFAYNLSRDKRAFIVGYYATMGAGGGALEFKMPEGLTVQITVERCINTEAEVHIEGPGIQPDYRIFIDQETIEDEIGGVDAAVSYAEYFIDQRNQKNSAKK